MNNPEKYRRIGVMVAGVDYQSLCRRGIKFHTKQSSNPVCTVLNDTHPEIKIHTNSYYKI